MFSPNLFIFYALYAIFYFLFSILYHIYYILYSIYRLPHLILPPLITLLFFTIGKNVYGIQKDVLCFYVYHPAMTLKRPIKVTLKFLNRYLHISLLILAANI